MLVVDRVCKSFGRMRAVDSVSFVVSEGEIFGIAGPNGAGKTTLFNLISGIPYHADAGRVVFRGQPIHRRLAHSICHLGLARTFQRETVFETLTVLENVLVGAVFGRPLPGRSRVEMAYDALEQVGLEARKDEQARHLPLFDKKKLMLASALVTNPCLLLLDEPAAGLNHQEVEQTSAIIRDINARGITIVLIEHVLPLLLTLSHRIMILNQGQKLLEGSPQEVVRDERVVEAYLGRRNSCASTSA